MALHCLKLIAERMDFKMSAKLLIWMISVIVVFNNCKKDNTDDYVIDPSKSDGVSIFPKPLAPKSSNEKGYLGWVGDAMPYYENGQFEIFFLHDATDQVKQLSPGQHPIHRFSTQNLLNFDYKGESIPYGSVETQDYLIGTGSMIRFNNLYYFYYTGHNGSTTWLESSTGGLKNNKEALLCATSRDLNEWVKKSTFKLKAPTGYSTNDFRDPFVFYNEEFGEYWMLVSTQQYGNSILLVLKTSDPSSDNWEIRGPLDVKDKPSIMMECSGIFKIGDKYYLTFSEDWSNTPGTHYRISESTAGPWVKPIDGNDMFDGHQFYGGRLASNGTERYVFGWAHRRNPETNSGILTWAGNLVTHQLYALNSGKLGVKSPDSVKSYFTKETAPLIKGESGAVNNSGGSFNLNGSGAIYRFGAIGDKAELKGNFSLSNHTGTASFGFNTDSDNKSTYKIQFEPGANRIAAYNYGEEVTRVPFHFEAGKTYNFYIIIDDSVAVLYLNEEVALTNRVYGILDNMWSLNAEGLDFNVSNFKILTH